MVSGVELMKQGVVSVGGGGGVGRRWRVWAILPSTWDKSRLDVKARAGVWVRSHNARACVSVGDVACTSVRQRQAVGVRW
jgi:hypothetical protein